MLPRVRTDGFVCGQHLTQEGPFVLDTRAHDVPNTIQGMVRALPDGCVALSLRLRGGLKMIQAAENEARRKNVRILWLP